jgi:hypothetical protein
MGGIKFTVSMFCLKNDRGNIHYLQFSRVCVSREMGKFAVVYAPRHASVGDL